MPQHYDRQSRSGASGSPSVVGKRPVVEVYSATARRFHWIVVALLAVQFPIGLAMVYRGSKLNIWDGLTNNLYSSHKLIGMIVLLVVVLRLGYRLVHGAPAEEPTLEAWHRIASALNHWGLYVLLILVPVLGWLGVSYYPALDVFGVLKIPGLVAANQKTAEVVFQYHGLAAFLLLALAGVHVGAALYHFLIRKDNVLARMIPRLMR
ncbi:MAG: cytochrome b [Hyphomicrobiaceae bacterium]|nr:cytochrome b [Hyphomicrobiaceae bacterium]